MALFTIADPHLSFGTDKPMDIFRGWANHTEKLKENWEKLVSPEDTVVLPGDISWGMSLEEAKPDFAFLNALPGVKILGKGNHDYWWTTMKKMRAFTETNGFSTIRFLFNNAFAAEGAAICGTRGWFFDEGAPTEENERIILREAGRLRTGLTAAAGLGLEPVVFLHYPVTADGLICEPLFRELTAFGVKHCFFGHIHGETSQRYRDFTVNGVRFSLISADYIGFCPRRIDLA